MTDPACSKRMQMAAWAKNTRLKFCTAISGQRSARLRNRRWTCRNFSKMAAGLSPAVRSQCAHRPCGSSKIFSTCPHFPYVHTGVLGEEPITEVTDYKSEIRQPDDELWATDCNFFQPQAAMSADDGQDSEYMYRITSPFVTVLYKTCPAVDGAWDLVGIFVQPREEDVLRRPHLHAGDR